MTGSFVDLARRMAIGHVLLCGALLSTAGPATSAERLRSADRLAIERTVRQQLEAFGRDDAARAFGFASPDIQRLFGSADDFLLMVQQRYQPVYRPANVQFIGVDAMQGQWVQTVQIVDGDDRVWRALFTMKRQPDKTWRVGGCRLVLTRAVAT